MAIRTSRVTVGTTATLVAGASNDLDQGGVILNQVVVANRDTAQVFIGPAGVTTATGFLLKADDSWAAERLLSDEDVYAVVASGTAVVHVIYKGA